MEYGSTKMEERLSRSPGGKLALWAFYTWCGYFVWAMARYIWVMSRIPDAPVSGFESDLGSTAGKWLGALVGFYLWLWSGHCQAALPGTPDLVPHVADAMNKTAKVATLWQRSAYGLTTLAGTVRKLVEKPSSAPGRGP